MRCSVDIFLLARRAVAAAAVAEWSGEGAIGERADGEGANEGLRVTRV